MNMWSPDSDVGLSQEEIRELLDAAPVLTRTQAIFVCITCFIGCGVLSAVFFAASKVFESLYKVDVFVVYLLLMLLVNVFAFRFLFSKIQLIIIK